jgi:hypothetical protein
MKRLSKKHKLLDSLDCFKQLTIHLIHYVFGGIFLTKNLKR